MNVSQRTLQVKQVHVGYVPVTVTVICFTCDAPVDLFYYHGDLTAL